ncbi:MAG: ADOP family duplicated permease [Gemmatimonadaceae bacterium]
MMKPLRPNVRRLFRLDRLKREDATRELHDEMELHIALRAEQLVRDGRSQSEAETEARRLFALDDNTITDLHETAIDRNRHMRLRESWDSMVQDTRYALRRLTREPGITAFIIGILALGIGLNVAAFSVVDRVLLRGPQYVRNPDQLVRLYSRVRVNQTEPGPRTMPWLPYTTLATLRGQMQGIEGIAAYRVDNTMVGKGVESEMRTVSMTSSGMFALLGVQPAKGRFYSAAEDADNVVVISERYWRTTLGSDPEVIGQSITIQNVIHTIIGVAPNGYTGPEFTRVDMWTPIKIASRNSQNMEFVARLKSGASVDGVSRELIHFRPQMESALPAWASWLRGAEYLAAPISYDATAHVPVESVMARWLGAISLLILLASCANVANLLLARLARRRREIAVRVALGSGRVRVMRLLGMEGVLLAFGAAVFAFIVIIAMEPVLQGALFPNGSWAFSLVDPRVLGAVAAFTLLTGALVSVVPALQAGRRDVGESLRSGNRAGELRSPLRNALTVVQAMLSVVLLVGAGLFLRSMQRVSAVDLGMEPDRVLTVDVRFPRVQRNVDETFADWRTRVRRADQTQYTALLTAARRASGVENAAVMIGVPFFETYTQSIWLPGRDSIAALPGGGPYISAVGDEYFKTMGTAIRRGRAFTSADHEGSEAVVIVSETMAKTLWPNQEALGQCISIENRQATCARVVGIAADGHRNSLKEEPSFQYYVPTGQQIGFSGTSLLVRPRGDVSTTWPELRQALKKVDPSIQSINVRLLSQGLDGEMRPLRLGMTAFGLSAILALIVAGLGLYSIMAHAVAWRRHEIGVRLALGARPGSIAKLVVSRGAQLATIGVALGILVALNAQRWVEPLLFNTSARDPLVFAIVIVTIETVALLAAWLPARRAVSVSPTEALRAE